MGKMISVGMLSPNVRASFDMRLRRTLISSCSDAGAWEGGFLAEGGGAGVKRADDCGEVKFVSIWSAEEPWRRQRTGGRTSCADLRLHSLSNCDSVSTAGVLLDGWPGMTVHRADPRDSADFFDVVTAEGTVEGERYR